MSIKPASLNKSFARRIGRSLSAKSRKILADILPSKIYTADKLAALNYEKLFLEIGFGMGEHFIEQIRQNPQNMYIGVEVYLNGVASCLKKLAAQQLDNYLLWADDLDLMLTNIKPNSLDGIYLLFPDPWPKKRYLKKRLFNIERLQHFKSKLKPPTKAENTGQIFFASDSEDYFQQAKSLLENNGFLVQDTNDHSAIDSLFPNYIETKYHKKALQAKRIPNFLVASARKIGK